MFGAASWPAHWAGSFRLSESVLALCSVYSGDGASFEGIWGKGNQLVIGESQQNEFVPWAVSIQSIKKNTKNKGSHHNLLIPSFPRTLVKSILLLR